MVLIHPASRRHSFNETRHELNSTGAWWSSHLWHGKMPPYQALNCFPHILDKLNHRHVFFSKRISYIMFQFINPWLGGSLASQKSRSDGWGLICALRGVCPILPGSQLWIRNQGVAVGLLPVTVAELKRLDKKDSTFHWRDEKRHKFHQNYKLVLSQIWRGFWNIVHDW